MTEAIKYLIGTLALMMGVIGIEQGCEKWLGKEKDLVTGPLLVITGVFSVLFALLLNT